MTDLMTSLAYLHGKPAAKGRLKVKPEDFFVSETLNFTPTNDGEHFLVRIRKVGENTLYVANELAKACGVPSRDVSWAGLKDRHAVTEQWFSVHLPGKPDPDLALFVESHEGVEAIVDTARHDKKLRPGSLIGNQFKLIVRDFEGDEAVETRLEQIKDKGVPNYFGAQRFGRNGNNVTAARDWGQGKFRVKDKAKRSFYLSAARSHLFNLILCARIEGALCYQAMLGDLLINAQDETSKVEDILAAKTLLESGQWQISGPMTGDNALPTALDAQDYEQKVIENEPHLLALIRDNRMRHERRSLLVYPQDMTWSREGDMLTVGFFLPAGSFATTVMREVIEDLPLEARSFDHVLDENTQGEANAHSDK